MLHIFQPFFAKNATIIKTTQRINPLKAMVIMILAGLKQEANAR